MLICFSKILNSWNYFSYKNLSYEKTGFLVKAFLVILVKELNTTLLPLKDAITFQK